MVIENTINYLERLQQNPELPGFVKKILSTFLDNRKSAGIKLFMIISALIGASFISAGIFSIISHNWDDFPKHLRGILSFIPALVALFFYYLALFNHSKSTVWKEASGLFLFFMIGASIAMVSMTYQMDGDFKTFVLIWLILSTPILYLTRTSSIVPFYLGLTAYFAFPTINWGWFGPSGFEENDSLYLFWIFFVALLPHYILTFNSSTKGQGIRTLFLSYIFAIFLALFLPFILPGGFIYWYIVLIVGYYILSRLFFNQNSLGQRPFDLVAYFILGVSILVLSASPSFTGSTYVFLREDPIWRLGDYEGKKMIFTLLGLLAYITTLVYSFIKLRKKTTYSKHILALPFLILIQIILLNVNYMLQWDWLWIGDWLVYLYVIGYSIHCLSDGGKRGKFSKILFGFILITLFLWFRYFDTELGFITKGLTFIIAGSFFFLLNFIAKDDLERIDDEK